MDAYIGEIRLVAFNFVPRGWLPCNGQLLPIPQYIPLFALLGNTFGGDGKTTFALPDLRGRVAIGVGAGPSLTPRQMGDSGGQESVTLTTQQLPAHTHTLNASSATGTAQTPTSNVPAQSSDGAQLYAATPDTAMSQAAIGTTGEGQPHENMPPFLALNYIICYQGIFPPRD